MITTIIIAVLAGFSLGAISGIAAYECPKCKCTCDCSKKQLLKG